jgi:hypothetical protein
MGTRLCKPPTFDNQHTTTLLLSILQFFSRATLIIRSKPAAARKNTSIRFFERILL